MLAFDERGSGEPLVLVHGLAASKEIWHAARPLLPGWRTIAIDVPGFGESAPVGEAFVLEEVARGILDGLPEELERFALVGHSMGGALAVVIAALAPERVSRLVLCAPAGLMPVPLPDAVLGPAGALWGATLQVRRRMLPLADTSLGRRLLLGTSTAPGDEVRPEDVRSMVEAAATATRVGPALRAVARADLRDELGALPMPVGLLWGSGDVVVPQRVREAALAARPDLQFAMVGRTGHLPMLERPEAFATTLLDLLDRLGVHRPATG